MVRAIRIYFEGDETLRAAIGVFLGNIRTLARAKGIRWTLIACGGRDRTITDFQKADRIYPDAFNVLLIDSDSAVKSSVLDHLSSMPTQWRNFQVNESRCHLMVQMMEAWFLADVDTLKKYYGKGFNSSAIPHEKSIERIEKGRLESALKEATRHTSKQQYHKTKHAPDILRLIDVGKVRKAAPHCDRLFKTLADLIEPPDSAIVAETPSSESNPP